MSDTVNMRSGWRVLRHGGRRTDKWRQLDCGPDEDQARFAYQVEARKLRQGSLHLVDENGAVVEQTSAPMLRTRW